jgi:pimeloyl-ACP methyl ester carboxylesterase
MTSLPNRCFTAIVTAVLLLLVPAGPLVLRAMADDPGAAPGELKSSLATDNWYAQKTAWHGFDQFHFQVAGRDAYLVAPPTPLAGKPWIWRARFPGYHAEMDVDLVRQGYHLGYFDVAGKFGCPDIVDQANQFYRFLVDSRGLNSKPVLEGVSRGGLFVYNWATANPDRVSCIYCDTPVCDIRSWPGGRGAGIGSDAAWKQCLSAYGLTEAQASQFDQQPIDKAAIIADAKIPILHIVSENDRVVPPSENTYRLRRELKELGHTMSIISVPQGTEKSSGHHFSHPDPQRVIEFIRRHADQASPLTGE